MKSSKRKSYKWSGEFSNRPAASSLGGPLWLAARPTDDQPHVANLESMRCTCTDDRPAKCAHVIMAIAQRRRIIHRGLAGRKNRVITMPDNDRLALAQIYKSFRSSLRAMRDAKRV